MFSSEIDDYCIQSIKSNYTPNNKDWIFIDLNFIERNKFVNAHLWSPCLNTQPGLWCVPYHRYATNKERLKLQGFPSNFKKVVSNSQLAKQIGNRVSIS